MIIVQLLLALLLASHSGAVSTTTVGNGDDGSDLENLEKITTGALAVTRSQAVELLNKLNVKGIPHLGSLREELETSDMYLVMRNVPAKEFDRGMEVSEDGRLVYARTFARPRSPTRFFPAALLLSEQQMVRLHIHEALHRALPEHVRENESIVSEITLALTEPGASFDSVEGKVLALVPHRQAQQIAANPAPFDGQTLQLRAQEPEPTERLNRPSFFRYGYHVFQQKPDRDATLTPVRSMHRLDSFLHPFGRGPRAVGLGLSFSYLDLPDRSYLGPVQISGRFLLSTWRLFDVDLWAEHSLYTLSEHELKNMQIARDTTRIGVSIRRDANYFYSENYLAVTLPSNAEFSFGNVKYLQKYNSMVEACVGFGGRLGFLSLGMRGDLILSQGFEVRSASGTFYQPAERIRLVRFGPELNVQMKQLAWRVFAQQVVDGTPGYNLDDIADLMGHGSGQGYVGSSLSAQF